MIEYHPDLPEGSRYQLARLGALRLKQKYAGKAPPPASFASLPGGSSYTFAETNHTVVDPFLSFWHKAGEVKGIGFPLSETFEEKSEVNGKDYIVQYFERAVMEYHPELNAPYDVQLTPLGSLKLKADYPNGAPMRASEPIPDTAAP